jgi:hypothetical protein
MNKQVGNRDKKIVILLIAAFAWLFIGSLIVFHQEQVLGKHYQLNCQLFISPKSKDKKEYTDLFQKSVLKLYENGAAVCCISAFDLADLVGITFGFQHNHASFVINDALITQVPLRAPPVA